MKGLKEFAHELFLEKAKSSAVPLLELSDSDAPSESLLKNLLKAYKEYLKDVLKSLSEAKKSLENQVVLLSEKITSYRALSPAQCREILRKEIVTSKNLIQNYCDEIDSHLQFAVEARTFYKGKEKGFAREGVLFIVEQAENLIKFATAALKNLKDQQKALIPENADENAIDKMSTKKLEAMVADLSGLKKEITLVEEKTSATETAIKELET